MNIYKKSLEQFQVNTKILNTLPAEWSKFVTDVKLVKDLNTINVDQIHSHMEQHERHANKVCLMHERNFNPLALVASHQMTQFPYQSHQHSHKNSQHQQQVSPYQSSQYGASLESQQYSVNQSSTPLSITYPSNNYAKKSETSPSIFGNQSFYIRLIVKVLRTVVEGTVRDQTVRMEPVRYTSYLPLHRYARMRIQQRLIWDLPCNTECREDHYISHMSIEVKKLTTGRLVNGLFCDGIDMVIKNLDLKPKDIIAEFYGPSWWKELSKESGSKILPCGDGSCWKAFKPIASLIPKGKLKSVNDTLTTELERYKE
ncbi:hypothetical protein Tco_0414946 [Tanacetum coccineum]